MGYWIYGLDERGPFAYDQSEYTAPMAFVIGAEGRGLHEHTAKRCDFLIRIPMPAGGVASLNASVAAGVVLFEWRRRLTSKEAGLTSITGAPRDPAAPPSSPAS